MGRDRFARFVAFREGAGRLGFIVILLGQRDRLLRVADAHGELSRQRRDRQVLITETTDEVEGLLRRLLSRQAQRIRLDGPFDCRPHVRRGSEEAIRRHQAVESLMRALEVVVLNEEREPTIAVGKIGEHRLREKLFPQCLPEALDLPERLRMLRSALDVMDPIPT